MSNEGNTNDPNRMNDASKTGQQSQGSGSQTEKNTTQQGGSTQKTGQQSQGGSQKDNEGTKQPGSPNSSTDQKKDDQAGQRSGLPK